MSCPYAEYNNREDMSNNGYNYIEDTSNNGYNYIENMVNDGGMSNKDESKFRGGMSNKDESKLPGVMSFLSPSLFNIQPGFNSCIYLQTLYKKLEANFKENINTQKIPIPPGVNYNSYFIQLRNELTDIISMKLENIQQPAQPITNPTKCRTSIECMFAPLRTFNKEIENMNFKNTAHVQAFINEYNKYAQNIYNTISILENKKTMFK